MIYDVVRKRAEYCLESTVSKKRTHWASLSFGASSVSSAKKNSVSSRLHTNKRLEGTHWVRSPELSEPRKTHWVWCLKPYSPKPHSARFWVVWLADEQLVGPSVDTFVGCFVGSPWRAENREINPRGFSRGGSRGRTRGPTRGATRGSRFAFACSVRRPVMHNKRIKILIFVALCRDICRDKSSLFGRLPFPKPSLCCLLGARASWKLVCQESLPRGPAAILFTWRDAWSDSNTFFILAVLVFIDERQITHPICARLKYDLYDFLGGVLGLLPFFFLVTKWFLIYLFRFLEFIV